MKLVKLSLAAVVAAGSFSFANAAVSLDDAIKNVDLSGFLRYRYDMSHSKEGDVKTSDAVHKYRAKVGVSTEIADNFKAVAVIDYNNGDASYTGKNFDGMKKKAGLNDEASFNLRDAYLAYTNYETTFTLGRMEIGSIWTDDLLGTGLKVVNNSIEGLTLAAYMFDNYNKDGDFYNKCLNSTDKECNGAPQDIYPGNVVNNKNLYGVAAIGSIDPVSYQVWAAYLASKGTLYAVDLAFDGGEDLAGLNAQVQVAGTGLKGKFKEAHENIKLDNGLFYAVNVGANVAGFDANVGYIGFGKKDKATFTAIEDKGQFIDAGEIIIDSYSQVLTGSHSYEFLTLGYSFDDVRVGLDAVFGQKNVAGEKTDSFEITPRVAYKYSDKLNFSAYYAFANEKPKGGEKTEYTKVRFEAKYSF